MTRATIHTSNGDDRKGTVLTGTSVTPLFDTYFSSTYQGKGYPSE